jgi:Ni/Co efflux regulator RcnB
VRSWQFGDFLPGGWFADPYWINDFNDYDLPYPPPGYEWVRVGPDALMVDRYTGRIVQVVRGIFW